MSRKDTILIAVLLNAGLLIVMFVLAIKPSHVKESFVKKKSETPCVIEPALITKKEIDKILTTYTAEPDTSSHALRPSPMRSEVVVAEKKVELTSENKVLPPTPKISITVQSGDVLEKIAKTHNTSVKEIMKFNNLVNTKLQIGQVIYLPPASAESTKVDTAISPSVTKQQFYTVRTGDTPWTIAAKNQLKVEELLQLNNLNQEKARYLKPGDRLRIR